MLYVYENKKINFYDILHKLLIYLVVEYVINKLQNKT